MSSATVEAQKLANEANIQMTQETNQSNRDIAAAQNDLNYKMFNEQNSWNLEQWNRENLYNSPSEQMKRYLQAGINPIWAMSKGEPGQAAHLTSATAHPAAGATMVAPQVQPEFDPSRPTNILTAANNLTNSLQGFYKLSLEEQDVDTRRSAQQSLEAYQNAQKLLTQSQTKNQDFLNNLNLKTADALIGIKQREYEDLGVKIENHRKEGSLTESMIETQKETKNQIIAMTTLTNRQADKVLQDVKQGWVRLAIEKQNADTNAFTARSTSYYQGEDLKLRGKEFAFNVDKTRSELKVKTNDQLLQFYRDHRGRLEREFFGNFGPLLDRLSNGKFSNNPSGILDNFTSIQLVGDELYDRFINDPSADNYKSYMEWQNDIQSIPPPPPLTPSGNASGFSVLNPISGSEDFQQ